MYHAWKDLMKNTLVKGYLGRYFMNSIHPIAWFAKCFGKTVTLFKVGKFPGVIDFYKF